MHAKFSPPSEPREPRPAGSLTWKGKPRIGLDGGTGGKGSGLSGWERALPSASRLPLATQSGAISECDHHRESIYREMTKQLLAHRCRHGGSPCLSPELPPPLAAPCSAPAAQPSRARPRSHPAGWARAVRARRANGAVKYRQSLPCMLMCRERAGGKQG